MQVNINHRPNLKEAEAIFKSLPQQKKLQKHCLQSFYELKRDELKEELEGTTFEQADIITDGGEIVNSLYIDDEKHIIYHVLSYFDTAFVMKSVFKERSG